MDPSVLAYRVGRQTVTTSRNTTSCAKRFAACAAFALCGAAAVAGAAPPIVAVFFIQDSRSVVDRMFESELEELTNYLSVRLAEGGVYRLTPPALVRRALNDMKAESYRPCVDEACQIELGKALAAEKLLGTRIIRIDTHTCAVTSTLYDLRTEVTERAATAEGTCDRDGIADGLREIVIKLRSANVERVKPPPRPRKKEPKVEALHANLNLRLQNELRRLGVDRTALETFPEGAAALERLQAAADRGDAKGGHAALRQVIAAAIALTLEPEFLRRRLNGVDANVARIATRLPPEERTGLEGQYLGLYTRINQASGRAQLRDVARDIDQFLNRLRRIESGR